MEVQLLKHQEKLIFSDEKKMAMIGGIGTGKSFTLAHQAIYLISQHPKINILLAANTYQQLMNATVKAFTQEFDRLMIPYTPTLSGARKRIEVGDACIHLYSLEKPDNIRGIEVGALLIDEAAYATEYAYKVCRGRLRQPEMPLMVRMVSSPNGYNWMFEMFSDLPALCVNARTCDNIFLPKEYYEELLELYGGPESPLARQELFGEFVNLVGLNAYWAFKRDVNVKELKYNSSLPTYIGVDFNIDNMNAVAMQKQGDVWYAIKHIQCGEYNSNTYTLGEAVVKWCNENGCVNPIIVPDSTGKARKTSSCKTDHEILKEMGLNLLYNRNPLIRDRHNNNNRLFKSNKLFINSSEKKLIKEVETLSREDDEGKVAHASVGMGYVLWKIDPLKKISLPSESIPI